MLEKKKKVTNRVLIHGLKLRETNSLVYGAIR